VGNRKKILFSIPYAAYQYACHYKLISFSPLCRGRRIDLFKDKVGIAQVNSVKKCQFIFSADVIFFR
jgi:hypothetical protein